ncbi:MAG: DUF2520 domain-containing protein [Desulfobacter postgatei]|uniref:Rossmann-like and DUF2520 domain-containing protein n=1 Tax=Desulfobacter postgatei TaxID=2293 RepID=UPI0023F3AF5F|nr:Rossmann-like and DUF2520 domain-containing protein [Desulfobacter postgatei]MDD4272995.1 DUF2520 domain-containing protein [Desulfobacter postgatei]
MNTSKRKFSVIGCGRVGICLAAFLFKKEYEPAGFFSRSRTSAQAARAAAGCGTVFHTAADCARAGDIVFITTPDGLIATICGDLAQQKALGPQTLVFHLSGAHSSEILAPAKQAGAIVGSIHPLQSFTPYEPGQANPFEGINISVEGDPDAVSQGKDIASALGARAFAIPTESKTLYHASAVVASNYLVTLVQFALTLLMETGLKEDVAFEILSPLIQGTLFNIGSKGCTRALTGPVVRGDHETVFRHLADIDEKTPQFSTLYRLLGAHTLDIAKAGEGLPEEAEEILSKLFEM